MDRVICVWKLISRIDGELCNNFRILNKEDIQTDLLLTAEKSALDHASNPPPPQPPPHHPHPF